MSVNLTLGLDKNWSDRSRPFCYDRLSLDWVNYDEFEKLSAQAEPLTDGVYWFDDDGLRTRMDDPYGSTLRSVAVESLIQAMDGEPLTTWDTAILHMLAATPPGTRVILYWH